MAPAVGGSTDAPGGPTTSEPAPLDVNSSPPAPSQSEPAVVADRLYWRAVVNSNRKPGDGQIDAGVAWHLTDCRAPSAAESHCPEGQILLRTQGNPDGHCLANGVCPRCAGTVDAVLSDPPE